VVEAECAAQVGPPEDDCEHHERRDCGQDLGGESQEALHGLPRECTVPPAARKAVQPVRAVRGRGVRCPSRARRIH
jgi:hypothetical protein